MPGEFDFISWIRSQQRPSELAQLSSGDDLAILKWKADDLLLVGVDQVLDTVHFDSRVHSPRSIGAKVMNRNLSDCAAMACLPAAAVATVALPRGISMDYAKELYLGMKEAGDIFDCQVVGGDTATWDGKLAMTLSILGRSAGIRPITRGSAKPGDRIYVTGPLGGSSAGRHMTFQPRVHLARELASKYKLTAMIDLSDGLSRDLGHICEESKVGALINAKLLPLHKDIDDVQKSGWRTIDHAVHEGEDYELLFTAPACDHPQVIMIGDIRAEPGIDWIIDSEQTRLEPKGWEHEI
ncbi:MAG TPA: thiamine-phosphate kinase [Tepidisphaeraceae bacterium]|nr:thiamine-phosphate kinase [Tepidisphaeraceae bacterium]